MTQVNLKKLLGPRGSLRSALGPLLNSLDSGIGLQDASGNWLIEPGRAPVAQDERFPVLLDEEPVGWVAGAAQPEHLAAIAGLLTYAVAQEAEKRSLAAEVLDRYRELSLLYTLSDKLAATPQPEAMAAVSLAEASRLIPAWAGLVLSICGDSPCPELMAAFGPATDLRPAPDIATDLIQRVLDSGRPELKNDVPWTEVYEAGDGTLALLCAPLKTENLVLGAILLVREPPQPFTAGELKLLSSVALQAAPALEVARLHEMAVEKARMERELQMGRQVQAGLIPTCMPEVQGWQFAAEWRPALEVAGDYFDLIPGEDGSLDLVIADVSGKGLPASLFMVYTRSILRAAVELAHPPAERLARVNRLLTRESRAGLFVTLFYAHLDMATGELTYVNAGHNPPLLHRAAGGEVVPLTRTGIALGVVDNMPYTQATVSVRPGDAVLFYTDGLTEAFDRDRQEFGMERLLQVLREQRDCSAGDLVAALEAAVNRFTGSAPRSDDLTLLAVKRL